MTRALLAQGLKFQRGNALLWLDKGLYYVKTPQGIRTFDHLPSARAYLHTLQP